MAPEIPQMQWAQVIEKTGGPVQYKQIPVQKPGPDEVLINIKFSGVCHTDLHALNGDWPLPTKLPLVGGHEGAGVVVAKGELVTDIEIGDHAGVKVGATLSSPGNSIEALREPPLLNPSLPLPSLSPNPIDLTLTIGLAM